MNIQTESHGKTGRNEPCPCGSGKKFKKCCIDKANTAPDIANFTNNNQILSMMEQIDKRVSEILEDLNNNHSQVLSQMSSDDFFKIVSNIYADKRYEKYVFTLEEMEEIAKKYELPPCGEDKESINKTRAFSFKAAKEKYTKKDIDQAVIDHYLHMIDCYDNKEYRESFVLARCGEELIEYTETQDQLPLFLFEKVLEGLDLYGVTIIKKEEQIVEAMDLDLTSLKENDGNIADFIRDLSFTSEQEKKAEEFFKNNPDVLKEQEKVIDECIKHMVNMILAGELRGLLLEQEDIKPARDHMLQLLSETLPEELITTIPQEQIEAAARKIMVEVTEEWVPKLLDDSRWVHIIESIKSEIEAIDSKEQAYRKRSLLTSLLLLENDDARWAKNYIGNAIIISSLKHQTSEDL